MKFALCSTWFSLSYYKFILFMKIKLKLHFGGFEEGPKGIFIVSGPGTIWISNGNAEHPSW